jgi:hypothetical protein
MSGFFRQNRCKNGFCFNCQLLRARFCLLCQLLRVRFRASPDWHNRLACNCLISQSDLPPVFGSKQTSLLFQLSAVPRALLLVVSAAASALFTSWGQLATTSCYLLSKICQLSSISWLNLPNLTLKISIGLMEHPQKKAQMQWFVAMDIETAFVSFLAQNLQFLLLKFTDTMSL